MTTPSPMPTTPSRAARLAARVRSWPRLPLVVFALAFVLGTIHFFTTDRERGGGPEQRIGTDGRYYYAQLVSIVLDRDLDLTNQYENPDIKNVYEYQQTPTGRPANPFSIGPALSWIPSFVVAHAVAAVAQPPGWQGGATYLHQRITLYASFLYAFLAMVLLYRLTRRTLGDGAALVGALVAIGAGPILHYAINAPSYAHAVAALTATLHLGAWLAVRERPSRRGWLWVGATIGAMALVRQQNLVFALPAVAQGALTIWRALRSRDADRWQRAADPVLGAALAVLVFAPQLVMWKVTYGQWLAVPQGEHFMVWGDSEWLASLMSSRNGLFPYAPAWALAICVGLWLVLRRDRALGAALLLTFALQVWLNAVPRDWWGGGAFGGRRFDGCVVHVAFGAAELARLVLVAIERHPRRAAGVVVGGALGATLLFNLWMVEDYRRLKLDPQDGKRMLKTYTDVALRRLEPMGNPLSWPASIAFAWRTGADLRDYDVVAGTVLLSALPEEAFRVIDRERSERLALVEEKWKPFIVRGLRCKADEPSGCEVSGPARLLLPLNQPAGVTFALEGEFTEPPTITWEGTRLDCAPPAQNLVTCEVPAPVITRGVNVIDLAMTVGDRLKAVRLREPNVFH